jgi:ubiquinone biosynthesis UbiH/UbiF/VisC/COQ6 family hydroxylase
MFENVALQQVDVAVLGSGLVAYAAALSLAQTGLSVALVGRAQPAPRLSGEAAYDNRVFALNAASRDWLRTLRVWDAMPASRVQPVQAMQVYDGNLGGNFDRNSQAAQLSFDAYAAKQEALAWIVESRELQQALSGAVQFHPRVTRVYVDAQSLRLTEQRMQVQCQAGVVEARLVVVAQPSAAALVNNAGFEWDEHDYRSHALVGTLQCERPHLGTAWQWFGQCDGLPSVLALLPLPSTGGGQTQNFVSLVWSTPLSPALKALPAHELAGRLTDASQGALGQLTPQGEMALWPLKRRIAKEAWRGRVVLVGDAAHVVHPLAGQGLNLGLQDVQLLAQVLDAREGFRPMNDERLARRYMRARAEQVGAIAALTHELWGGAAGSSLLHAALRERGMQWVDALPWLKRELVAHAQGTAFLR